jgi:pimeloyl-ACP methyl ester carboxylesterase
MRTSVVPTRVGAVQVHRGGDTHAGPPIVYLHSAQGEGESLLFLDQLAETHRVLAPVFPGFGSSEGLDQIDDLDDAVFHLLDLWGVLSLDAAPLPVVVGLSLGGWMAVEMATRYPEKVGALVLVNPAGLYLQGHEIKDIFGRTPGELAADLFFDQNYPVAQMMHALDELTADVGKQIAIPFEVVKPIATTLAATAKLAWDPYLHNPKLPRRLWRITCPSSSTAPTTASSPRPHHVLRPKHQRRPPSGCSRFGPHDTVGTTPSPHERHHHLPRSSALTALSSSWRNGSMRSGR